MEIYNSNYDKIDMILTPKHTGMVKFIKLKDKKLNFFKKIKSREFSLKNYFRKIRNLLI